MPEEKKTKSVGKCEGCGKALEAYVVANGKMFCSDKCVQDTLVGGKKKKAE